MRLFGFLLLAPCLARSAQLSCPWIDKPTAAGLLGGPVQLKATEDSCQFSRPGHELVINVHRMSNPKKEFAHSIQRCGKKPVAIHAIGNQAFACPNGSIVARVRDVEFTVHLTAPSGVAELAHEVAEHVAGALF
jgi:hypothetical protein